LAIDRSEVDRATGIPGGGIDRCGSASEPTRFLNLETV
jgi:hypothetical protein